MDLNTVFILLVLSWLILGLILWLIFKNTFAKGYFSKAEIAQTHVPKELMHASEAQMDAIRADVAEKEQSIIALNKVISAKEQQVIHLEERLQTNGQEKKQMEKQLQLHFENLANRILEEKSQSFSQQNQVQIQHLLHPLKEKIQSFEANIHQKYMDETKERVSLKKEIEQLKHLNLQLSEDAANLVDALKGDSKIQGDWGELQLNTLLEKAGLNNGIHFNSQVSYRDENGQIKRPDFIVNLPDGKHLIIDSKVSLKAYEQYFNATDKRQKETFLSLHIESIKSHIRDLASKNYTQLYQINTPDYLLMFIPIEPAFATAVQKSPNLYTDALERNVVLVTTSTLLATMRTVSFIWKQEKQKRNVLEIARQSGLLYDKFCGFVEDMKQIGMRLDHAQSAYADAMNKMTDSRKFGDTLIGRAERIKELGAKTNKSLPQDMLE